MADEPKEEKQEEKSETKVSAKVAKLVDQVAELTVLELSELVNALQDKLGVSAMPMAAAAPASGAPAADAGEADAGGGNKTVVITAAGGNKIAVIKAIKEIDSSLGLQEAKAMTESLPAEVLKDAKAEDAKAAAEKLTAAGATVELK